MTNSTPYKDLFSRQSSDYAKFRPTYPQSLFQFLASQAPHANLAWDCGTGNGQSAVQLAQFFKHVIATDPSQKQLEHSISHPKVEYRQEPAEHSSLENHSVDLITVAQAFHWFRQADFFSEVKRVLKPCGLLALWCYELAIISPAVDALVYHLYKDLLGSYWEQERLLVEEGYRFVDFAADLAFTEIALPSFEMGSNWSLEHLVGYLSTWSALQAFIQKNNTDPLEALYPELTAAWGNTPIHPVRWKLAIRVCRRPK